MKKTKDNDIIVSSIGNSTDDVTGSCWTISYKKNNGDRGLIVIECGISQEGNTTEQIFNSNKRMLENIGKDVIKSCEYLILLHSHADHVANSPIFNDDNGFKGKILSSYETMIISKEIIKDSQHIHEKNVEYMNGKGSKVKPFYTKSQMYQMFEHMESIEVGEIIKLNENVSIVLNNNSHVIGSTNLTLIITKPNNQKKVICYTSDMGSEYNKPFSYYLKDQVIPSKCNLFISEATYNDKSRQITYKESKSEREDLKNKIKQSLINGKRILLPTFSFSRSQLLVTYIYKWFKDEEWFKNIPVVIDGVLINNINDAYLKVLNGEDKELFRDIMSWKNVKKNRGYDSTIATLSKRVCGIYITSSGFLTNGRITTYLPQFLECSNDVIIITGYCGGKGSLGNELLDDSKRVISIGKRIISKRCEIIAYKTFTSHISYDELLKLWASIKCDKIIVHHSSSNKDEMIKEAKDYLFSKNKTTKIVSVSKCCNQFVL